MTSDRNAVALIENNLTYPQILELRCSLGQVRIDVDEFGEIRLSKSDWIGSDRIVPIDKHAFQVFAVFSVDLLTRPSRK